jgi:hypothetical protein
LLERLKLAGLWSPRRVRIDARGQAASQVLSAMAAQTGNHVHIGDPYGHFADKPLDKNYEALGFLEAVDDVCRQSGNRARPHYDMHTPGIVVSAGAAGNFPRAYAGPLRAQITTARRVFNEELNYEEGRAELAHSFHFNLQFTWEDRFRIVGYAAQPGLVEAVTDNGIHVSAAQGPAGGWNATTRGLRQVSASLKLNPVPVAARKLDVLRIKWGLVAVGEPAVLEIAECEVGKLASQDDVSAQVEAIEPQAGGKFVVTLNAFRDLAMPEPQEIILQEYDVEIFDAQGRAFRLQSQTPAFGERGVQLKIACIGESAQSQPKSLKLHYPRLRARRELELVFRDVPLPTSKPE